MQFLGITVLLSLLSVCGADTANVMPAFAWGSKEFVQAGSSARRVNYKADSTGLLDSLLDSVLGSATLSPAAAEFFASSAARPDVTIVFFGRKADARNAAQLTHLSAALDAAPASVSMPHLRHEAGYSLQDRLAAAADAAGEKATVHHVGSCSSGAAAAKPLKSYELPTLTSSEAAPAVILVCPAAQDSLADEAAVLNALNSAVAASGARHLFIYASNPQASAAAAGSQRTLLARDAAAGSELDAKAPAPAPAPEPAPGKLVCDDKCKTQVSQLEAGILGIVLLVALGFGVYCMGLLDTPTRFETIKEDNR